MGLERKRIFRIGGDFAINILASVIYTFARQIVVFPLLAAHLAEGSYGTLLTVVGLCNVCTALIGNSLNNIRLVQNSTYEEQHLRGDFNPLIFAGAGLSALFGLGLSWMFHLHWLTTLLLVSFLVVSTLYQYASVLFRLNLDFKRNLVVNIFMSAGYIAAALACSTERLWPAIFLLGELAGLVYTAAKTDFLREPLAVTPLLGETSKKYVVLMAASLVSNLLMYADRMIIYPALGAASVSYYSTASFFGKSAGIVMTPIAGVLLSYFAQKNFQASKKLFTLVNGLSLGSLALFGGVCLMAAPWFTQLLYPTLYAQSAPYLFLANLGAIVAIAGNMAQPMILRCCSTKWILAVQVVYGGVYLGCALTLMPLLGLTGFCWAAIAANAVRLLVLYAIGYWKF